MIGKVFINKENKTGYVVIDNEVWFLDKSTGKNTKCILFKTNIKCAAPQFVMTREEFEEHYEPKEDVIDRIKGRWDEMNKGGGEFKEPIVLEGEEINRKLLKQFMEEVEVIIKCGEGICEGDHFDTQEHIDQAKYRMKKVKELYKKIKHEEFRSQFITVGDYEMFEVSYPGNYLNNLAKVGKEASEAGTKLKEKVLYHGSPLPIQFDYESTEKMIMANFVQTVELATQKIKANHSYQITEEEKVAIVICSGANFTTKRVQDSVIFDIDNVSVQWNGEKFLVAQKQKGK